MDIKQILVFIAIYEEGSVNRAAQRLTISQPSASSLLRNLELDLGAALFERRATGMLPTTAGEALLPRLQAALAELDSARKAVRDDLDEYSGILRVGIAPTVMKGVISTFLPRFLAEYPNVELRMREGFSGRLIEWTLAGELDLSVIAIPPNDRRLVAKRITIEPVVLISSRLGSRVNLSSVSLPQSPPVKLVLPWQMHSLRDVFERFIQTGAIPVERTIEMDTLRGMLDLVQRSDWVTLLPITAIADNVDEFVVQYVTEPAINVEFYQIHPARGALSAAARKFSDELTHGFELTNAAVRRTPIAPL